MRGKCSWNNRHNGRAHSRSSRVTCHFSSALERFFFQKCLTSASFIHEMTTGVVHCTEFICLALCYWIVSGVCITTSDTTFCCPRKLLESWCCLLLIVGSWSSDMSWILHCDPVQCYCPWRLIVNSVLAVVNLTCLLCLVMFWTYASYCDVNCVNTLYLSWSLVTTPVMRSTWTFKHC